MRHLFLHVNAYWTVFITHSGARWMFSFSGVCQFVCLFVNTVTSEWLNVGWYWTWQLGALHKSLARVRTSRSEVKNQGHRAQKTKMCGILFGNRPLGRDPRAAFFSGAVLEGVNHYAGGKISACCLVLHEFCVIWFNTWGLPLIQCLGATVSAYEWSCCHSVFMVALCNRETIYIFILFLLLSSFFFFFLA